MREGVDREIFITPNTTQAQALVHALDLTQKHGAMVDLHFHSHGAPCNDECLLPMESS